MKKIALLALLAVATPAIANDFYYAEYTSPDAEYVTESMSVARDNYVGLR